MALFSMSKRFISSFNEKNEKGTAPFWASGGVTGGAGLDWEIRGRVTNPIVNPIVAIMCMLGIEASFIPNTHISPKVNFHLR